MSEWKNIKIHGISSIEKCVAEFNIWDFEHIPYGKFKVKIYEDQKGIFHGYTNLAILNDGIPDYCSGTGKSIEEALDDTVRYFMDQITEHQKSNGELSEEDFEWGDPSDF